LIPYIYSMAWRNTDMGMPLITPLYYSHPDSDDAYHCPQAYWFGTELLAAPFTTPVNIELGLSRQRVWLPEGDWFNYFSGEPVASGWQTVYGGLGDIPVFAKAGAIVPLGPKVGWGGVDNPDTFTLQVFAGADNRFTLYEDDGETTAYLQGRFALTAFEQHWEQHALSFSISQVTGDPLVTPAVRNYKLVVHGIIEPEKVSVTLNGEAAVPHEIRYGPDTNALTVTVVGVKPSDRLLMKLSTGRGTLLSRRDRRAEHIQTMLQAFRLNTLIKAQIGHHLEQLLSGEHTPDRYDLSEAQLSAIKHALDGLTG
jgi:hypothetical protein